MNVRALCFALCYMTIVLPATRVHAAPAACPTTPARFAEMPHLVIPDDAKPTSKEVAAEIEVGSDGRVRALQIDKSSGDAAIDLGLRQALQAARYEPPRTGCVAYSGGFLITFGLPAPASAPPSTAPALPATACAPFTTAFLTPVARERKRTGTAIVAVPLDAAGSRTGEPFLHQSTGSAALDAEALRIARTAQYGFVQGGPCMPQAFTYNLELTFE